ncbi:MAG TPA: acylphosphatase [Leptolyngbyaceae cyanobacterium]
MENESPLTKKVRAHVFVSGDVQGVGYRLATWDKATQWGIAGWVEEIADGRVEAVFEGSKELVDAIVSWCYRGSPDAVVKGVTVQYEEPEGLKEFIIRRSREPRIAQKRDNPNTKTVNVLLFVHGLMITDTSVPEGSQYDLLWEPVKQQYDLSERIDEVVRVRWGQYLEETTTPRLDEKINLAEKFISDRLNFDRLRENPSPNNVVRSGMNGDLTLQPWWRLLVNPLRESLLLRGFGDAVYYVGEDGRIAVQLSVYRQVLEALEQYRSRIERDIAREELNIKVRLHAIGTSLGTMIINDFLHGLFSNTGYRIKVHPEQAKEPKIVTSDVLEEEKQQTVERYQFWRLAAQKRRLEVGSIVTMASQIPVLLLRSQRVVDAFANGETLPADEIGIPPDTKEIIWKIFYDIDDVLAFPVRPLFGDYPGIQDIQVDVADGLKTHVSYWRNETIHEQVAELLNRRVVS